MYHILPDPHPGRCLNFRHDTGPEGKARRCLEREGTRHECRFEPEPECTNQTHAYVPLDSGVQAVGRSTSPRNEGVTQCRTSAA